MFDANFILSNQEKEKLLQIARFTIEEYLSKSQIPKLDKSDLLPIMEMECGSFVTLHKNGSLRGCIGRFTSSEALYKSVQKMAVSAATQDNRFSVVKKDELNEIDIEISVLTPLKKIQSIDEIEMGRHGIYIKKGFSTGTFLPQVAIETGWTKEEFLGYCAKNKVGIGWDGWKEAELFIYDALVFGEKDFKKK